MNFLFAFIFGGLISGAVQIFIDKTRLTPAKILVGLVSLGVLLYAVGVYSPLYELSGCGVSIPLIGFGAAIGRGVKEAVDAEGALGILKGGLGATAAGITTALFLGLLLSLTVKGKEKRM